MLNFVSRLVHAILGEWKIFLEPKVSQDELTLARERGSIPSFGFFLLLGTACIIATLGLLADSAAAIIGAMIVAPLMNPILSMSYGITTGNVKLYRRSLLTIGSGTILTVVLAYGLSATISVPILGSEILSRTEPTLVDLGIALAAGAAGAFSLTRQSIASSIAGVAISVALVPPLCVMGIGLQVGAPIADLRLTIENSELWTGSFLLFMTNLAAISFASCLVFLTQSYGSLRTSIGRGLTWIVVIMLLAWPLWSSFQEIIATEQVRFELSKLQETRPGWIEDWVLREIEVELSGRDLDVELLLGAKAGAVTEEKIGALERYILDNLSFPRNLENFRLKAIVAPIEVFDRNLNRLDLEDLKGAGVGNGP